MPNYFALVEEIARAVDGFVGCSVVDLNTGMALAARSRPGFDLEVASAFNSEMVKGKYKTLEALGLDSQLEDMLLTLSDQLHLIRMLRDETFVYLVADRSATNLALMRHSLLGELRKQAMA